MIIDPGESNIVEGCLTTFGIYAAVMSVVKVKSDEVHKGPASGVKQPAESTRQKEKK